MLEIIFVDKERNKTKLLYYSVEMQLSADLKQTFYLKKTILLINKLQESQHNKAKNKVMI